jgi:hypothetical protein
MMKILAAVGLGSALMLAPVLAFADDAAVPAPAADATMAPKPMHHHRHHAHHVVHHHVVHHHVMHHHAAHHMMKKPAKPMEKPAEAPKS